MPTKFRRLLKESLSFYNHAFLAKVIFAIFVACKSQFTCASYYYRDNAFNKLLNTVSTPCNYPFPGTKSFRQCTEYLGLGYFCDPTSKISQTEAYKIDRIMRQNYTSCLCATYPRLENSERNVAVCGSVSEELSYSKPVTTWTGRAKVRPTFAVAIISKAIVEAKVLKRLPCTGRRFQHHIGSNVSAAEVGQLYADVLRLHWSSKQCHVDIMIVLVEEWSFANGTKRPSNQLFGSFSSVAENFLDLRRRFRLLEAINKAKPPTVASDSNQVPLLPYHLLNRIALLLTEPIRPPRPAGIPDWATALLVCCGVLAFLLAAVGHFVNRINAAPMRFGLPRDLVVGAGQRKWQVGFLGGLWNKASQSPQGPDSHQRPSQPKPSLLGAASAPMLATPYNG